MVAIVSSPRYVLLGLASGEPAWMDAVARLAGRRSPDDEFIRCTGPVDLATRLGTGRPFSAVLVDHRTMGLDRQLVRRASAAGCPVIVVGGADDPGRFASLGAAAHMDDPPSLQDLDAILERHATPIGRIDDLDGSPPVDVSDGLTGLARSFGSAAAEPPPAAVEPLEAVSDGDPDQAAQTTPPTPAVRSDEEGRPEGGPPQEDAGAPGHEPSDGDSVDGQAGAGSDRTIRARVRSAPTGPGRLAVAGFMATGVVIVTAAAIAFYLSRGTVEPPAEPPALVMEGGPVVAYMGTSYQIGRPGDVAVVRSCDGRATAWLLRPSTGAVYRFETWATDQMVITEPIRIVAGGESLRLAHSLGCTDVHVDTADGRVVPLTEGS
jgi:hypothetical protein|tara:strand:+ start:1984 stop:3117 length:1134 start_codon:yes stop_codon:yes gene_type:complete